MSRVRGAIGDECRPRQSTHLSGLQRPQTLRLDFSAHRSLIREVSVAAESQESSAVQVRGRMGSAHAPSNKRGAAI